jgi:hypothetical protein
MRPRLIFMARSSAGSVRAFPTFGRRLFLVEQRLDHTARRQDLVEREIVELRSEIVAQMQRLTELSRRSAVVEHQTEQLHFAVARADPQLTFDVVEGVRTSVARLSAEVLEQANSTSDLLVSLGSLAAETDD